jgi:hypothetical protein
MPVFGAQKARSHDDISSQERATTIRTLKITLHNLTKERDGLRAEFDTLQKELVIVEERLQKILRNMP